MPVKPTPAEIQTLSLFADLAPVQQEAICRAARVTRHAVGTRFYREGRPMPALLLLLMEGGIQISRVAASGKESVLRLVRPGELFGAVAVDAGGFFHRKAHLAPTTATAYQTATVLSMDRDETLALIQQAPSIATEMLIAVSERLVSLQESFHAAISERARVRIARQILYHLGPRAPEEGAAQVETPLPHQVLSRLAGIAYEESVRIIRDLAAVPPILSYRRGGRIEVHDVARLRAIAWGEDWQGASLDPGEGSGP